VADLGLLGIGQDGPEVGERAGHAQTVEFPRESRGLDPLETLEELDQRYPGRIRSPEQVGWSRACPRRTGWIEQGSDVSGIAAHGGAESPHRKAGALEDLAERGSELVVVWWHLAVSRARSSPK
jgi:hypothetical protein